jgi:hypothetical protein
MFRFACIIATALVASWFETRAGQRKRCRGDALLTMRDWIIRVSDLILRSPPKAGVSKDAAIEVGNALGVPVQDAIS